MLCSEKSWCYAKGDKNKFRFKGLNEGNILLTGSEDFIEMKNDKMILADNKQEEINNFYNTSENNIKANVIDFYENIYNKKDCYVLCRQFKKSVRNSKKNVGLYDVANYNEMANTVSITYTIKNVKVK